MSFIHVTAGHLRRKLMIEHLPIFGLESSMCWDAELGNELEELCLGESQTQTSASTLCVDPDCLGTNKGGMFHWPSKRCIGSRHQIMTRGCSYLRGVYAILGWWTMGREVCHLFD